MNPVIFDALSEPNRFHIVELLRAKSYPVGEIAGKLHIRQPQASKHLRILADAGIVTVHPQANRRIYGLSAKRFQEMDHWIAKFRGMWEERLDRLDALLQKEIRKGVKMR